ncbi:MAG TPA: methyltransferase domain-containing protein [Solirubrobacter sp.]|nr:methyltransferase domain-containing protein [Solirubrobacter sp.]
MTTETTDDARRAMSEIAEAIAPTWERRRAEIEEICAPVRAWMVRELAPRPGDTVLELAAGPGDTGFEAAAHVGERGRLITSDLASGMLAAARRRGAELGVRNVEYRLIDAERIELEAGSVDGVLCRFAYMLMPNPPAALAGTCRVLRPGGRLAHAVWGAPERNPFFATIAGALVRRGQIPPPEPPPAPGVFSMASAERTTALLEQAGFGAVRCEEVAVRFTVRDAEGYLDLVADTAGPIGLAVRALSPGDHAMVRDEMAVACEPFAGDDGLEIPGVALCAAAARTAN